MTSERSPALSRRRVRGIYHRTHQVIETNGADVYYVFDSLSVLSITAFSDRMVEIFMLTCLSKRAPLPTLPFYETTFSSCRLSNAHKPLRFYSTFIIIREKSIFIPKKSKNVIPPRSSCCMFWKEISLSLLPSVQSCPKYSVRFRPVWRRQISRWGYGTADFYRQRICWKRITVRKYQSRN